MKNIKLKLAILGTLGIASVPGYATGFVALPDTGFASSAYTSCYNDGRVMPNTNADDVKGNFGSYPIVSIFHPSASINNTCWISAASLISSPKAGYVITATRTTTIPTSTGGSGSIGRVNDVVWRNAAKTMCVFGSMAVMTNTDHDSSTAGKQLFEINDIARGGFSTSGTVNVAYTRFGTYSSPVYRVGRTFTSVQHRALQYNTITNRAQNGINYLDLPTKNSVAAAVTGENTPINATDIATTTLASQDAVVNSNWVDFTADTLFQDSDGSLNPVSGLMYIEAPCDATSPYTWVKSGAIRLRQTGRKTSTLKEIAISGFAPPGAIIP